jgi:hypothetical protein
MTRELRAHPREKLSLRVLLADGSTAVTRDLSMCGMYVEVPLGSRVDDWVSFEFAMPETGLKYVATGQVVRVEPGIDGIGIALKLHEPQLIPDHPPSR